MTAWNRCRSQFDLFVFLHCAVWHHDIKRSCKNIELINALFFPHGNLGRMFDIAKNNYRAVAMHAW